MKMMIVFIFLSFLFPTYAQSINDQLSVGFKFYQDGQYEQAKEEFKKLHETNKNNSFILYNLGLAEYKLGNIGFALGLWHKASVISPGLKEARSAISYAEENLDIPPEKEDMDGAVDYLRQNILPNISSHMLFLATILLLFFFWKKLLKDLILRKATAKENLPVPGLQTSTYVFLIFLIISASLSFIKIYDNSLTKGVVVLKKLEAKTGPGQDQVTLFVLTEGTKVIIKEKLNDWYKVETPKEKLGWVPSENIFVISDN